MPAVGAFERVGLFKTILRIAEFSTTNFAKKLPFRTIVFIKVFMRSIATRTNTIVGNVANRMTLNGQDFLAIPLLNIVHEGKIMPNLVFYDVRKSVHFVFLVFRRVGIIKSPLFKRNKSADE